MPDPHPPKVGLFATCLVELYRPSVARASVRLLEAAGCEVDVPRAQTCCGQPVLNSGDRAGAARLARRRIGTFERYDYTVAPPGSCAAVIRRQFPDLLADDPDWRDRATALADRTHELTSFLAGVMRWRPDPLPEANRRPVTCHDACSGLRELGIKAAPRRLLEAVGVEVAEMTDAERCCGFGGLFAVKYDDISAAIGRRKLDSAEETGAGEMLAGEMGCLLHLAGLAGAEGRKLRCRHIAEVLAGMDEAPAIGQDAAT